MQEENGEKGRRDMSKPMKVWIYACQFAEDPVYQGGVLSLPAHREAVRDAFQRARLKEGEPYLLDRAGGWPGFIESVLDCYNHTLEELNLLAYKLAQMTEKQLEVYEGVLKALPERNMKQVINGLYNLERFEFLPGIQCDNEIGEMTIDNELDPILKDLPGDIYPLLDTEKVGAYIREKENGVFTSRGYCYRVSGQWQEIYDGKQLPEQVEIHPSQFSLYLVPKGTEPEDLGVGAWLELPYDEASKIQVLENLGLESFKECRIAKVHTAAPLFEQLTGRDHDIDRWNHLAMKLSSMTEKELLKYKAVAEFESCSSIEMATELTDMLDQYAFDPVQVTYAPYGRECLEQMGADLEAQAFRRFDFEGYGKEIYAQTGRKLTAYGAVSKEPGLEEVQSEEHAMMTQGMG